MSQPFLNTFDLIVIGATLFIGLKGLYNGFVREFFGLIGLMGGLWVAVRYAQVTGEWLGKWLGLDSSSVMALIGFAILLFLIWGIGALAGTLFSSDRTPPLLDRIGGMAIASLKSFLILSVIVYALYSIDLVRQTAKPHLAESLLFPWMDRAGSLLFPLASVESTASNPAEGSKAS